MSFHFSYSPKSNTVLSSALLSMYSRQADRIVWKSVTGIAPGCFWVPLPSFFIAFIVFKGFEGGRLRALAFLPLDDSIVIKLDEGNGYNSNDIWLCSFDLHVPCWFLTRACQTYEYQHCCNRYRFEIIEHDDWSISRETTMITTHHEGVINHKPNDDTMKHNMRAW